MENIERQLTILKGIDWEIVKNECLEYALQYAAMHENIEYAEIKKPLDNAGLLRCFCLVQAIINALESNKRERSEPGRDEAAQRT